MTMRVILPADEAAAKAKVESAQWGRHLAQVNAGLPDLHPGGPTSPAKLLRGFYALIQPALDAIGAVATCGKGCSYCCHIPVRITDYEADLVAQATGRKAQRLPTKKAKKELVRPGPCPFLQDGACSVYEARPLICRVHYSVDDSPQWCDYSHGIKQPVAYVDRRPLELMFIQVLMEIQRGRYGKPQPLHFQDIRQWFPTR